MHFDSDSSTDGPACGLGSQEVKPRRSGRNSFRQPPPYRGVPSSSSSTNSSVTASSVGAPKRTSVPFRAKSVPPSDRRPGPAAAVTTQVSSNGICAGGKPLRPKSIHYEFPASSSFGSDRGGGGQTFLARPPLPHGTSVPIPPSRSFRQSVSLQFDALLASEWPSGPANPSDMPVPSPAPVERRVPRSCLRSSRADDRPGPPDVTNKCVPRSFSVPRSLAGRNPRPLSHPAAPQQRSQENLLGGRPHLVVHHPPPSLHSSRSYGHLPPPAPAPPPRWPPNCLPLVSNVSGKGAVPIIPAPASSPSSTPSPSSRLHHLPLAHLPYDGVPRTHPHPSIRLLQKKLDLYVDIIQSQERFVQVDPPLLPSVGDSRVFET